MSKKIYSILTPDEVNIALSNYVLNKRRIIYDGEVAAELMIINNDNVPAQYRIEITLVDNVKSRPN